jgi:hypothetical protein
MVNDWKGPNINIHEVIKLISENLYSKSKSDHSISNLAIPEKIENYKIFDFEIYEDDYEIEEIFTDYLVLNIVFQIIFKTELNYSGGNSYKRIIKHYIGESHFRYLLYKEEIVAIKITQINLSPDSPW